MMSRAGEWSIFSLERIQRHALRCRSWLRDIQGLHMPCRVNAASDERDSRLRRMGSGANHRLRIARLDTAANIGGIECDFESPAELTLGDHESRVQIAGPQPLAGEQTARVQLRNCDVKVGPVYLTSDLRTFMPF